MKTQTYPEISQGVIIHSTEIFFIFKSEMNLRETGAEE